MCVHICCVSISVGFLLLRVLHVSTLNINYVGFRLRVPQNTKEIFYSLSTSYRSRNIQLCYCNVLYTTLYLYVVYPAKVHLYIFDYTKRSCVILQYNTLKYNTIRTYIPCYMTCTRYISKCCTPIIYYTYVHVYSATTATHHPTTTSWTKIINLNSLQSIVRCKVVKGRMKRLLSYEVSGMSVGCFGHKFLKQIQFFIRKTRNDLISK